MLYEMRANEWTTAIQSWVVTDGARSWKHLPWARGAQITQSIISDPSYCPPWISTGDPVSNGSLNLPAPTLSLQLLGCHWCFSHTIRISLRSQEKQPSPPLSRWGRETILNHTSTSSKASWSNLQLCWGGLRIRIFQRAAGHAPTVQASLKARRQDKRSFFSGSTLHPARRGGEGFL